MHPRSPTVWSAACRGACSAAVSISCYHGDSWYPASCSEPDPGYRYLPLYIISTHTHPHPLTSCGKSFLTSNSIVSISISFSYSNVCAHCTCTVNTCCNALYTISGSAGVLQCASCRSRYIVLQIAGRWTEVCRQSPDTRLQAPGTRHDVCGDHKNSSHLRQKDNLLP